MAETKWSMIIFTKHARDRMRERRILKSGIEKVILNPDRIQRENGRVVVSKRINRKSLEIIYVIEDNKKIILTCYYI